MKHPYQDLSDNAFWKTAIANRHFGDIADLAQSIPLQRSDKVATAGSCFAQYIGNRLAAKGANFLDFELAPENWQPDDARRHGFGVYSCRYGNIYTVRQLLQLAEEALGEDNLRLEVWEREGRYFDAFRPSVDPEGHDTPDDVEVLRQTHLIAVRKLFTELDVLVLTLGLTEAWENRQSGAIYPTAPGTIAGDLNQDMHGFVNFRYPQISADLNRFWELLTRVNPKARIILTVSPVPLTATASGQHVLAATTYSKSVLRAVAEDFTADHQNAFYFPSYEIISSSPSAGWFFNPDKRTVNAKGVDFVMQHFFSSLVGFDGDATVDASEDDQDLDVVCEEGDLEKYATGS